MANLEEQNNYDEGIYQIETDDVVIGGPDGVANKSAKNLANRTAWLKTQLTLLNSALDGLSISDITNLSTELGFSKLEIDNAISAAGLVPDDDKITQLADAIKHQINDVRRNKNAIVDGRFDHWLEGVSQTSNGYGSDTMWENNNVGSTKVHTREALVLGVDIPEVPTAKSYSRTVITSVLGASNYVRKLAKIEDVRSFAGKTVTISFYARADSPKDIAIEMVQNFGSGGSSSITGIAAIKIPLTTTLQRYDVQISMPDIIGKIIGAGSYIYLGFWFDAGSDFSARTDNLGQQSGVFDIACVQLEEGQVMTAFDELLPYQSSAAVGYYYQRHEGAYAVVQAYNAATAVGVMKYPKMREGPAIIVPKLWDKEGSGPYTLSSAYATGISTTSARFICLGSGFAFAQQLSSIDPLILDARL